MKIFEHLTQLDNAVGFYRKGIIAILIVCAILMTAMYIHTETDITGNLLGLHTQSGR